MNIVSIFVELSGREANRDVQLPYCVTLVLHTACWLFFLLPFIGSHRCTPCQSLPLVWCQRFFAQWIDFPLWRSSLAPIIAVDFNSNSIPEKYCLILSSFFCFIWLWIFFLCQLYVKFAVFLKYVLCKKTFQDGSTTALTMEVQIGWGWVVF